MTTNLKNHNRLKTDINVNVHYESLEIELINLHEVLHDPLWLNKFTNYQYIVAAQNSP